MDVILWPGLVGVPATVATPAARSWRPRRSAACARSRGVSMAVETALSESEIVSSEVADE
jgi:hypothetical protein